jgi:hypothetical protein
VDWDFCKSLFGQTGFGWGKSGGLDGFLVVLVRYYNGLCSGLDAGAYKKGGSDGVLAVFLGKKI